MTEEPSREVAESMRQHLGNLEWLACHDLERHVMSPEYLSDPVPGCDGEAMMPTVDA
jgi:hypothetical protein